MMLLLEPPVRRSRFKRVRHAARIICGLTQGEARWCLRSFLKIAAYYVIGAAFYVLGPEQFNIRQAVYFMTVSFTTVGYGDISPSTDGGKIFAMLYILIGIGVIFPIVATIGDVLVGGAEKRLFKLVDDDPCVFPAVEPPRNRGVDPLYSKIAFSLFLIITPILIGMGFMYDYQHANCGNTWTGIDALWWSFVTVTTVGYGDLSYGCKVDTQYFLTIFIFISVFLVALAIQNIARSVKMNQEQLREQKLLKKRQTVSTEYRTWKSRPRRVCGRFNAMPRDFDMAMIKTMDKDGDGVELSEYILAMLIQLGHVDEEKVALFTRQFHEYDADGSGKLTVEDLDLIQARLKGSAPGLQSPSKLAAEGSFKAPAAAAAPPPPPAAVARNGALDAPAAEVVAPAAENRARKAPAAEKLDANATDELLDALAAEKRARKKARVEARAEARLSDGSAPRRKRSKTPKRDRAAAPPDAAIKIDDVESQQYFSSSWF